MTRMTTMELMAKLALLRAAGVKSVEAWYRWENDDGQWSLSLQPARSAGLDDATEVGLIQHLARHTGYSYAEWTVDLHTMEVYRRDPPPGQAERYTFHEQGLKEAA